MAGDVNIFLTPPDSEGGSEDSLVQATSPNGHTGSADMQHHCQQPQNGHPEGVDSTHILQGAGASLHAHVAEVEVMVAGEWRLEVFLGVPKPIKALFSASPCNGI